MLKIVPFHEEHIEDAARLVSDRYQRLRDQVPELPQRYSNVNNIVPLLQDILKPGNPAVAALQGNHLVGFLTGWQANTPPIT